MRSYAIFLVVSLSCFAAALAAAQTAAPIDKAFPKIYPAASDKKGAKKQEDDRVGQIFVVGDTKLEGPIRKEIHLVPGAPLDYEAVRKAQKRLIAFDATIAILDSSNEPGFKDILVTVKKKTDDKKEPVKQPATLEQQIAEALKNNPDIRVAEAKVREVEAELNRTRMKVVGELSVLHAEILAAKAALEEGKERWERAHTFYFEKKAISKEELSAAKLTLTKLTTELAALQAKLPYLLGKQPGGIDARIDVQFEVYRWDLAHAASSHELFQSVRKKAVQSLADIGSPMTDKLRKALDTPMTFPRAEVDLLTDLMEFVRDKGLDFNIIIRLKSTKKMRLNIQLEKPIPLGAFLQYLEDELGVVFVLRDYGIVVTAADERLPPGAIRVVDFWKHGKTTEKHPAEKEKADKKPQNPPPGELRGLIGNVDSKYSLVQISVGSDAGLKLGHTLEVFRLQGQPKYLGTVLIVEVMAQKSVGRVVWPFNAVNSPLIQAGDHAVSSEMVFKP